MVVDTTSLSQAAQQLREAEKTNLACAPIRDDFEHLSADQKLQVAYQIKQFNHCNTQRRSTGAKIGMTSSFIQELFGITQPDYGHLYDDMQLQLGEPLSLAQLIAPKLEVEWALKLKCDITDSLDSVDALMACVEQVHLGIEIVDSRIENWNVQALDLIADNGSSGRYLISKASASPTEFDLLQQSVQLLRNGELMSENTAEDNLGNPWEFARWTASKCVEVGAPLAKGDYLFTGTITPIQDLHPGETWTASAAGFTDLSLTIAP